MNTASLRARLLLSFGKVPRCLRHPLLWSAALATTGMAADVDFIAVIKGQRFQQTGPDLVALRNPDETNQDLPLILEAFAEGAEPDSLVSGTLELPGGASVPLAREFAGDSGLRHDYQSEDPLDLDTIRPNGTYTFHLTTRNDGARTVSVNLAGNTYPPVPKIANYASLQALSATASTIVQWPAMTGGTTTDFIMLSVQSLDGTTLFETAGPGAPGALNGTSVQATIPANTLPAGATFRAELLFVKTVDLQTGYAMAIAGYHKLVGFRMRTAAVAGQALGAGFASSIPQPHASGVPRDSAISFRFSHPMSPGYQAVTWSGTGLVPANFTYNWIDNNRVLLCKYTGLLPGATELGWSLNLTGFRDAAGFALAGTAAGVFGTAADDPGSPPEVTGYYLFKTRGYRQTGTAPVATGLYGCDPNLETSAYNRLKQASLTVGANGFSGTLQPDVWDPQFGIEATYADKSDFDRFFANGTFTFNATTIGNAARTYQLVLGPADDYPAAPAITNLTELQAVDPAVPATLTWNALAGWAPVPAEGASVLEIEISNDAGDEVYWLSPEDATSASQHTIPAGTLWPGRTYHVSVNFINIKDLDTTTHPGAFGAGGFSTVTEFTLKTTGTPVMPALALQRAGIGMNVAFSGGEPNRSYVLETSSDLARWLPKQEIRIGDPGPFYQAYDSDARFLPARFYRLRDLTPADGWIQPVVTIQGTVWADQTHHVPLVGAVVGTSLDGRTTVTNSAGGFFLETDTPSNNGSHSYTIRVTVGPQLRDFGPFSGDQPREQHFEMQ